jgi:hypothetical protein
MEHQFQDVALPSLSRTSLLPQQSLALYDVFNKSTTNNIKRNAMAEELLD